MASTARAGFSAINPTPLPGNYTQASVLDHVYGGSFTLGSNGVDYTNGTLTAVRVSDTLPSSSTSDNPGPNATDQLWQDSTVSATAEASCAEVPSTPFGYTLGSSGGSFTSLFPITGSGFNVTGSGTFSPGAGNFRFEAENKFGIISTLPSENADGMDRVVTYEVDGLGDSLKTWLLFFNDYGNSGTDSYFDYQNLVIQLKTLPASSSSPVPEPGSLMLIGGAAIALFKRVPKRLR